MVAFNGRLDTITLGSASCRTTDTRTCTYGGSQPLGTGTLTWEFLTPNTLDDITFDPFSEQVFGPAGGTFSASDGVSDIVGTYAFTSWADDGVPDGNGDDGVDLNGTITITSTSLSGQDLNLGAFESYLGLPAASYGFTLDLGDCFSGIEASLCIAIPDPSAQFTSLSLSPQGVPEPATFGAVALGLAAAFTLRRRPNKKRPTPTD
jgi:hypothetical protein